MKILLIQSVLNINYFKAINHAGIVKVIGMYDDKRTISVIMELLHDDMLEYILKTSERKLTEDFTRFLMFQILVAVDHLHTKNIVHCDLKPENVLLNLTNPETPFAKICDFGYSRIIGGNTFRKTIIGTPVYRNLNHFITDCLSSILTQVYYYHHTI